MSWPTAERCARSSTSTSPCAYLYDKLTDLSHVDRIRHLTLSTSYCRCPPGQRRQGAHRPAEAAHRDRAVVRRSHHRAGPRGHGVQLFQARGRHGPVHPPRRDRRGAPSARTPPTSTASTSRCCGPAPRSAARASPPGASPPSTSRCGTSKPARAGLPLAKLLGRAPRLLPASTTPPAASCRPRSRRSRRRPPPRWSPASAASRSRSASRTGRPTCERVAAAPRAPRRPDPLMVDANQQWDRARARRMCRELEEFDLDLDRGAARRVGRRRPRGPAAAPSTPRSPRARC